MAKKQQQKKQPEKEPKQQKQPEPKPEPVKMTGEERELVGAALKQYVSRMQRRAGKRKREETVLSLQKQVVTAEGLLARLQVPEEPSPTEEEKKSS